MIYALKLTCWIAVTIVAAILSHDTADLFAVRLVVVIGICSCIDYVVTRHFNPERR